MHALQNEMNRIVAGFMDQVTEVARRAVRASLEQSFGPLRASKQPARRPGRPPGTRGDKRTPEDLAALSMRLVAFVREHPGLRIEQINKAIGTTTKELVLPIRKLLDENIIQTQGRKRSTTYYAKPSARS